MKILSYNTRGLGKKAKRKEVRIILQKHSIDLCCLQETKLESISENVCKSIWGHSKFDWAFKASVGSEACICVVGDFNAIRSSEERVGRGEVGDTRDMAKFDELIPQCNLVDMPLSGRTFMWYRPDGTCKSKLDSILVNSEWIAKWPNQAVKGLSRTLSDHCPIYMASARKNWGPRPFRFINAWVKHPKFKDFFESKWSSYQVHGWTAFRLKEKLKCLRNDLKVWNKEVFGEIDKNITDMQWEIEVWDRIDDTFGLEEGEVIARNKCSAELLRFSHWKENFMFQQSKMKWVLEGDVNSGYFHGWINKRRKVNEIDGLFFDEVWTNSVEGVKNGVQNYFLKQFKSPTTLRLSIPRLLFARRLDECNNQFLTAQFSEDEVKAAIWSCDSNRSPGPDGFSFGFIKDQWDVLKNEIMNMMFKFHQHGRLPLSYLGLNVGIKHWRISSWDKLVARVRGRLAKWNDKNISLGGRATLIQSVLSSIPIINVFPSIESSKTPWIGWNTICKDKKLGGLGIRNLVQFNVSLLSKWIWRFLNEPNRLWARIIKSRHGGLGMVFESTTYREGARRRGVRSAHNTSGWWRDICNIYVGKRGMGVCNDIQKVVGNGEDTYFWRDSTGSEGRGYVRVGGIGMEMGFEMEKRIERERG
ncbi:hypothetical protein ACS0TY_005021 [Phlomoides rotata]